jgi:hypothetical protein
MVNWKINTNIDGARTALEHVGTSLDDATERTAAEVAAALHEAKDEAFSGGMNPRTGEAWTPPASATTRDPRYSNLGNRQGTLKSSIITGYAMVPMGARAFINVDASARYSGGRGYGKSRSVAMVAAVFLWGRRGGGSKSSNWRKKRRAGDITGKYGNYSSMPGRVFYGLPQSRINHLIAQFHAAVKE